MKDLDKIKHLSIDLCQQIMVESEFYFDSKEEVSVRFLDEYSWEFSNIKDCSEKAVSVNLYLDKNEYSNLQVLETLVENYSRIKKGRYVTSNCGLIYFKTIEFLPLPINIYLGLEKSYNVLSFLFELKDLEFIKDKILKEEAESQQVLCGSINWILERMKTPFDRGEFIGKISDDMISEILIWIKEYSKEGQWEIYEEKGKFHFNGFNIDFWLKRGAKSSFFLEENISYFDTPIQRLKLKEQHFDSENLDEYYNTDIDDMSKYIGNE